MKRSRILLNVAKFLFFLSIGLVIFYLVYRSQNTAYLQQCAIDGVPEAECSLVNKVLTDFRNANFFWLFMVIFAFTISNVSRTIRWNMLIHPMDYRPRFVNSFLSIVLAYFANLGLPRIGEVVRATTLSQYEHIPVQKVMGTIVTDRILDVISILLITGLVFLLEFDTILTFINNHVSVEDKIGGLSNLLLYASIAGLALGGLFLVLRRRLQRSKLYRKVVDIFLGFWQGIQTIRQIDRPWWFLFHSINIWFMYFMMTYFCFFAFEPTAHLSPVIALVVFIFGGWGVVIPSPGGMGTYHFLAQTALTMYGVSSDDGFSWANIAFFSIQLGSNVLGGLLALILLPLLNRGYQPEPKASY